MDRQTILDALHEGVVTVVFHKVDGSKRNMRCTLHPDYLPAHDQAVAVEHREKNLEVIPVWDTEKLGWRSFRVDSVISVD